MPGRVHAPESGREERNSVSRHAPNHTMQRMRANRLGQLQFERSRRLARTADGER
jgi:hypothetical protein